MSAAQVRPPHPGTEDGRDRRVGFELELAGIDMDTIDGLIVEHFGGNIERDGRFSHRVRGTALGDFGVEIDTVVLKHSHYRDFLAGLGVDTDDMEWIDRLDDSLARLAATVVPHEIVAPPIPLDRIPELDRLRDALRRAQAQGTRAALRFAFGLHINPEAPALTATSVAAHLKAFLLLRDALKHYGHVDFSRRVAPFIRDFPERYARRVVAPDYAPDWAELVTDYLTESPTRNRPLDLLPLFAHCHPEHLSADLREDPLISPRPTYHYRLPNCAVDEADWTLGLEWGRWVAVERLADDPEALATLGERYRRERGDPVTGIDRHWAERTASWLDTDGR